MKRDVKLNTRGGHNLHCYAKCEIGMHILVPHIGDNAETMDIDRQK